MEKVAIFGAGNIGMAALNIIGEDYVTCFIDNNKDIHGSSILGKKVISLEDFLQMHMEEKIVVSVSMKYEKEIIDQLAKKKIENYCTLTDIKHELIKIKTDNGIDYLSVYNKTIKWIKSNTIDGEGIICCSSLRKPYPEVSGYYIPTLLRWGYRELALQYAKWLVSIQNEDGSWCDTEGIAPYIFDTAQIIKGLLAIRDIYPKVDDSIIKGCDWILSHMTEEGRLVSPIKDLWGDGKTFSELIHTYCISPIIEVGRIFDKTEFLEKADKIAAYYTTVCRDNILNFDLLSHFQAYVLEAMIDIGHEEIAVEAMEKIALLQKESGAIPGYNNVDWVCSTGLFQLALVWFRLGDMSRGNRAFEYACKLQNESGGWFGSYLSEERSDEENTYFPDSEISWASKYFLDALYYKQLLEFENQAARFVETIDVKDGRYQCIEKMFKKYDSANSISALDVGCGKGRYLRNLILAFPSNYYCAVDMSTKVMGYFDDLKKINKIQGSLTNIPFADNHFDITYTCEALEHAIDIEKAVSELCRVTKPGGVIAIVDKNIDMMGYLDIDEWEQWFSEEYITDMLMKYCSEIYVEKDISYDGIPANGLFLCWFGKKKANR